MQRLLLLFLLVMLSPCVRAQSETFAFETEAELSLSLYQECEETLSRSRRWLSHHPRRATNLPNPTQADEIFFILEAFARDDQPIPLQASWVQTLEALQARFIAHDSPFAERFKTFDAALLKGAFPDVPCSPMEVTWYTAYLSAIAASSKKDDAPQVLPTNWRTQLALRLVNTQRCDAKGGYWDVLELPFPEDPLVQSLRGQRRPYDETLWAVFLLQHLMGETLSVNILPPPSSTTEK